MKKLDLSKATRLFYKMKFTAKKHSPEILVGAGIVGTVTASVMACKATTKAGDIVADMHEKMDQIHEVAEMGRKDYTEDDLKKDTAIVYVQTGVSFAKLYAPSVILGAVSISSILAGHNITRKRNVALSAAYMAVDKTFKDYRKRVVDRFGDELDKELRYNIQNKTFETIEVDEKGKEKVKKETVAITEDPNEYSEYARFYDDGCSGWTKDPERNLSFLKMQQSAANEKFKRQGYMFLNDIYKMLNIPVTAAGQQVGWIYDEKNPIGDNYIDFGLYDSNRETVRNFVNGYERTILLDFNVDGNILRYM